VLQESKNVVQCLLGLFYVAATNDVFNTKKNIFYLAGFHAKLSS